MRDNEELLCCCGGGVGGVGGRAKKIGGKTSCSASGPKADVGSSSTPTLRVSKEVVKKMRWYVRTREELISHESRGSGEVNGTGQIIWQDNTASHASLYLRGTTQPREDGRDSSPSLLGQDVGCHGKRKKAGVKGWGVQPLTQGEDTIKKKMRDLINRS